MTKLIVSLEDKKMLGKVKAAIGMLRGVASVKVCKEKDRPNAQTLQAMREAEKGDTIKCGTIDGYLKLVDNDL